MTTHPQDLSQTIVLTGGTSGLGYYCARTIAASYAGLHLVIASRRQVQGTQVVNALKRETGNQQIEWMPLDLASLSSVRAFAEDFTRRDLPPLRAIVCNAGLNVRSGTRYTQDGFEMTFGVNCLGHFLLVNLLLRSLATPARIIFVSSDVHDSDRPATLLSRLVGATAPRYRDAKALAWPERYPDSQERHDAPRIIGSRRYSTSKLCDLFYAYELDRRLQAQGYSDAAHPITVNAFNPGPTPGTGLGRDAGIFGNFVWNVVLPRLRFAMPYLRHPNNAGRALARLVLDPALEGVSSKYFDMFDERTSSRESYDQRKATELWETSAEVVKLLPEETILSVSRPLDEANL